MMRGQGNVIIGWKNKVQATIAAVAPADMTADMHRRMAESGSGRH